jgi:hypothetical protein
MKKKFRKLRRRRNAGPPSPGTPRRRGRLPRRGAAPDWRTTLAAVAGGAGGAALGGLMVNQQIFSPEAVGLGMIGLGGATAYFADGNARVLGNSVAAAGAGQLALAMMASRAMAQGKPTAAATPGASATPPRLPGTAPAKPGDPPRRASAGGGVVVDLFRDAARELDELDADGWPGGTGESEPPAVIDVYDEDDE